MPIKITVSQFLSLTPDQRTQFVKQNLNNEDDAWNIENITGWEDLPKAELGLFLQQLRWVAFHRPIGDSNPATSN